MLDLKDVWTEFKETGNRDVRERIILDCMPLVKYVVRKVAATAPNHFDREELIQSGIFGLIDAIERYNPQKGVKFETYAVLRIRGAVIDELRSRDWVPRSKRKLARELDDQMNAFEVENGREPTTEELAEVMGVSQEEMKGMLDETSFVSFVSLSEPCSGGGPGDSMCSRIADLLSDSDARQPITRIEFDERVQALSRAITELPEQERIVITLYYHEEMRLKDIGELFGVSESRTSQIHGRALTLLKLRMNELLGD